MSIAARQARPALAPGGPRKEIVCLPHRTALLLLRAVPWKEGRVASSHTRGWRPHPPCENQRNATFCHCAVPCPPCTPLWSVDHTTRSCPQTGLWICITTRWRSQREREPRRDERNAPARARGGCVGQGGGVCGSHGRASSGRVGRDCRGSGIRSPIMCAQPIAPSFLADACRALPATAGMHTDRRHTLQPLRAHPNGVSLPYRRSWHRATV